MECFGQRESGDGPLSLSSNCAAPIEASARFAPDSRALCVTKLVKSDSHRALPLHAMLAVLAYSDRFVRSAATLCPVWMTARENRHWKLCLNARQPLKSRQAEDTMCLQVKMAAPIRLIISFLVQKQMLNAQ